MVVLLRAKSGAEFIWEEVDAAVGMMMPFGSIYDCHAERIYELQKTGFPARQPSSLPKVKFYSYF